MAASSDIVKTSSPEKNLPVSTLDRRRIIKCEVHIDGDGETRFKIQNESGACIYFSTFREIAKYLRRTKGLENGTKVLFESPEVGSTFTRVLTCFVDVVDESLSSYDLYSEEQQFLLDYGAWEDELPYVEWPTMYQGEVRKAAEAARLLAEKQAARHAQRLRENVEWVISGSVHRPSL